MNKMEDEIRESEELLVSLRESVKTAKDDYAIFIEKLREFEK